jgi:hypothetical protein
LFLIRIFIESARTQVNRKYTSEKYPKKSRTRKKSTKICKARDKGKGISRDPLEKGFKKKTKTNKFVDLSLSIHFYSMHHIKEGIAFQTISISFQPSLRFQHAMRSTTCLGITYSTPNI